MIPKLNVLLQRNNGLQSNVFTKERNRSSSITISLTKTHLNIGHTVSFTRILAYKPRKQDSQSRVGEEFSGG